MEHSQRPETKHYALTILEDVVKYKWNITPDEHRQGIKSYIISYMLKLSASEDLGSQAIVIDRVNRVIVAVCAKDKSSNYTLTHAKIAKQDWPHRWPKFVLDIVEASRSSEVICENGLKILALLKEELFDFSKDTMTSDKIKELQQSLSRDFGEIFELCQFVLRSSQRPSLISIAINTVHTYLRWFPMEYVFQTDLLATIILKFLPQPEFSASSLTCLIELASISVIVEEAVPFLRNTFKASTQVLEQTFLMNGAPNVVYEASDDGRKFVQDLSLYYTTLFMNHLRLIECEDTQKEILVAHNILVNIFSIRESDVFKICQDYWLWLSKELNGSTGTLITLDSPNRRSFYAPILKEVRMIIIDNMAKPEEIIIVEDENGNVVREKVKDSDQLNLYRVMKETLVLLTHLDSRETKSYMLHRLDHHLKGLMSVKVLNPLCWAIGSIAGAQNSQMEDDFLVTVLRELLTLTDTKRDKGSKAIVASNIMYIVGQYPRFLKENWTFLRTVVVKLFEFMRETHEGVQDMACDTFLKIAKGCKKCFVVTQHKEVKPYLDTIISKIMDIIALLDSNQIHTFYEALAEMASAGRSANDKELFIRGMMELPNQSWNEIMTQAKEDVESLKQVERLRKISNILVTNIKVCERLGNCFNNQLALLYLDMLEVYRICSQSISQSIIDNGPTVTRTILIKAMRTVKQKTLTLIEVFVKKSTNSQPILTQFVPPLLMPVLQDYNQGIPDAKDPEVMSLMAQIVEKCSQISSDVPTIFDNVFQCTLNMITQNFEDYPDHRVQFYKLIRAVTKFCFDAILSMSDESFKLIMDCIIWGFKHTMRVVSEIGLLTLSDLLDNVRAAAIENTFYVNYAVTLLNNLLFVLTDGLHKRDLAMHARVLQKLFSAFHQGKVTMPIWGDMNVPQGTDNALFIRQYITNTLTSAFPNLSPSVVGTFITKLFESVSHLPQFKNTIRDFLVQIKEFSASGMDDNQLLYTEERDEEEVLSQQVGQGM